MVQGVWLTMRAELQTDEVVEVICNYKRKNMLQQCSIQVLFKGPLHVTLKLNFKVIRLKISTCFFSNCASLTEVWEGGRRQGSEGRCFVCGHSNPAGNLSLQTSSRPLSFSLRPSPAGVTRV